ncbi:c7ab7ab2-e51b-4991-9636-444a4d25b2fe [Sclerotinia trifoliorum]|uniref:C7ab7ab2-e51b-4991-9636-444a4d25b2fe n=1 Tax=Sclerotinia trifoliorum TaxID=28548 RepID=A0A8H2ZPM1_9HELO|nr:c7ab7ab2-e51b-4991-9636-444a4d25b2fe [Sclerotinia trifoliorum]
MNSHPPGDRPGYEYYPPIQPSPSRISNYASSSATLERLPSYTSTVRYSSSTGTESLYPSDMALLNITPPQNAANQGIHNNESTSSNSRSYPPSAPALRDNSASHPSSNNGSQYQDHIRQDAADNRVLHRTSHEPQHPADNRMEPSNPYHQTRYHTSPTLEYHPQSSWSQETHPSSGYQELYQTRSTNGPQYSEQSMATSQDPRYPTTAYDALPSFAYHDGRGYTQDPGPSAQPMAFKQSAPRQRTAIACQYCRRRKIRCTGFNADGSSGKCSNCTRFKQECIFTPVSSAQAFVPLQALYAAKGGAVGPDQQVYGAHGQPMPKEFLEQSPPTSHGMFAPPQSMFNPSIPEFRRRMSRSHHPVNLPPLNISPRNRDATTLPSPTDSLGSQKRKREADEQHYARSPPSFPDQYTENQRGVNIPSLSTALQGGQRRSSFSSPAPSQHFGYQQRENPLVYRFAEESRQLASLNPYEVPRKSSSSNGSASSFQSQLPYSYYPSMQLSPRRSEPFQLPQEPPLRRSLSPRFSHPMAISSVLAPDNEALERKRNIDRMMVERLRYSGLHK